MKHSHPSGTGVTVGRRNFINALAASGLAMACTELHAADVSSQNPRPEVCVYSEQFQSLSIPDFCQMLKQMEVDGLDLTVRPGGYIEPKNARDKLQVAAQAAQDHGLKIMMLTTGITAPDRDAEEIFAACQRLGINRIKLGYYRVEGFGTLASQLDAVRRQLEDVMNLAAKYDVRPCVHVHSGPTIPSNGMMLYYLIREFPPERIGAYLDSHHMTLTGGAGGWRQAIDLLTPWLSLVALKNFQWERLDRDATGQQQWKTEYCRLEDGIAPVPDFVNTIHKAGYRGFYTLHTEYRRPVQECIRLTTEDFTFLRKVFEGLG